MYYVILTIPLAQYDFFVEELIRRLATMSFLSTAALTKTFLTLTVNAKCRFSATKTKHDAPPISGDPAPSIEDTTLLAG